MLIPYADEIIGVTNVDVDEIAQRPIRYFKTVSYWRKPVNIMVQYVNYLQISRKPMIQLGDKYYTTFSLSLEYPGN
jgi:hypothetical protein